MKILVLNPMLFSEKGSSLPKVDSIKETMIYSMCLGFKEQGNEVTLLAMDEYRPQKDEQYDFEIKFFKNNGLGLLPLALPCSWDMHKYIKANAKDYDMVLCSECFGFHSLSAALVCPEKTLIWQELNRHQKKFHHIPSKVWHNCIVPMFFSKIRVVVGRSDSSKAFICRFMKRVANETVDHGVNLDKFKTSEVKKKQFISVARLIHLKNIDGIIRNFKAFVSKYDQEREYKLLIAGKGEMEQELKALTKAEGLSDSVEFLGFLDHKELNRRISESMASLVNTRQDLNMVSIPESIVSGTPILTNMVPALADYINTNGLGVAKNEWGADEMKCIVDNNPTFSAACRNKRTELSNRTSAQRLIDIFRAYENTEIVQV